MRLSGISGVGLAMAVLAASSTGPLPARKKRKAAPPVKEHEQGPETRQQRRYRERKERK